jgi:hypothetical protein
VLSSLQQAVSQEERSANRYEGAERRPSINCAQITGT